MEEQAAPATFPELFGGEGDAHGEFAECGGGSADHGEVCGVCASMENMETVLEPGLTATMDWSRQLGEGRHTLPTDFTAPRLESASGTAGAPLASTPIPAPHVAVMDPSESVPSAATLRATIESCAAFVMR